MGSVSLKKKAYEHDKQNNIMTQELYDHNRHSSNRQTRSPVLRSTLLNLQENSERLSYLFKEKLVSIIELVGVRR